MNKAHSLPDAAIIDKGFDKVTKSRGAMDKKFTHDNIKGKITLIHMTTKVVTVTDLITIYLLNRT